MLIKLTTDETDVIEIHPHDMWDLDRSLGVIIAPCLRKFKEVNDKLPSGVESVEEFDIIIDKMIAAFAIYESEDYLKNVNEPVYKEGMELFSKHFCDLWV